MRNPMISSFLVLAAGWTTNSMTAAWMPPTTTSTSMVKGLSTRVRHQKIGSIPFSAGCPLVPRYSQQLPFGTALLASLSSSTGDDENDGNDDGRIDISLDPRFYRIRLPRAPGIEWGTDLSFCFVYVRELDPTGPAAFSGKVNKGDQLCEIIAVPTTTNEKYPPVNLLGASFDTVMGSFAMLDKTVREVDLVFFQGTKDELKVVCQGGKGDAGKNKEVITVTVVQNKGSDSEQVIQLQAKPGVNVRQLLVDNGINVYQSVTRWTNCKGKQLCGTCIVNVSEGLGNTNWKSMDEASTLRENPESYRLSCVTFAYEDVTVETFPPIKAAQWTR